MPNLVYNSAKRDLMNGTIDLDTNNIRVMLVTSAYSPLATHEFRSSVTNEVVGAGYTLGGLTLNSPTVTVVGSSGVFDAADSTWTSSTITARGAVIFKSTGNSATDSLLGYIDFVSDQISSNGTLTIQWATAGVLTLS